MKLSTFIIGLAVAVLANVLAIIVYEKYIKKT